MKTREWIVKLLLLVIPILFIGGCKMFENKPTLTKEQQDTVVRWIDRGYNVSSVEFTNFQKDNVTGSYHLQFKLNNKYKTGLTVNDSKEFNNSDGIVTLGPIEDFRKIEKNPSLSEIEKVDISSIKIKYLGE